MQAVVVRRSRRPRRLRAYAPAPREQFQRWFGMTSPAEAGRWIAALGDEVVEVDVEGTAGWMLAADVEAAAAAEPAGAVRLLPGFDHYVVAAPRDAAAVLPGAHRPRVSRPQGWLSPVVVVDGRVVGVWEHDAKGGVVTVTVTPFGRRGAALREGVQAEADRLAGCLGGEADVVWASAWIHRFSRRLAAVDRGPARRGIHDDRWIQADRVWATESPRSRR